jgi:hypothetical protein
MERKIDIQITYRELNGLTAISPLKMKGGYQIMPQITRKTFDSIDIQWALWINVVPHLMLAGKFRPVTFVEYL